MMCVFIDRVVMALTFGAMIAGQIASFAPDYVKAKTSAARIFKLLDKEPDIDAYSEAGLKPVNIISLLFKYSLSVFLYCSEAYFVLSNECGLYVAKGCSKFAGAPSRIAWFQWAGQEIPRHICIEFYPILLQHMLHRSLVICTHCESLMHNFLFRFHFFSFHF